MTAPPNHTQQLEIWLDGACELCRRSRTWCERRDPGDHFDFRDFRTADDDELPLERAAHETSMWVRTGRGEVYGGFDAWRIIMSEIPGWRWIARLSHVPPFSWLGPPLYRLIARFRTHLA